MKMLTNRRTLRLVVLAALAVAALALWNAQASAQPAKPPFLLYGMATAGDAITVYDAEDNELGATVAESNGSWHMSVNCAAEKLPTLTFQLNGAPATPTINQTGADQAEITLTLADAMPDDGDADAMADDGDSEMMEDDMTEDGDEMMEEDDSSMMEEDDDKMMDDEMSDDDEMMDNGYPESGTGGLADQSGPSTAALIGTVSILLALVLSLGVYRLRANRS